MDYAEEQTSAYVATNSGLGQLQACCNHIEERGCCVKALVEVKLETKRGGNCP
jgi:hypothetical protein